MPNCMSWKVALTESRLGLDSDCEVKSGLRPRFMLPKISLIFKLIQLKFFLSLRLTTIPFEY